MKKCGIYILEAMIGHRIGIKYVGKTKNLFDKRNYEHTNMFQNKNHFNKNLQRYYDKYGENSLKFIPLMECSENELNFWEKWWIKCFDSRKNGFNQTDGGEDIGHSHKKCTLQNFVTGEIDTCESVKEFARKHNISLCGTGQLLLGRYETCGDWFNPNGKWKPNYYKIISPDKKEYKILNRTGEVKKFCLKHNLNPVGIRNLLIGKRKCVSGWTRPDSGKIKFFGIKTQYKLINPEGNIIKGENLSKLCKEYNLDVSSMSAVMNGRRKSSKGWIKYKE